jgi:hypothetical protein
MDTEGITMNEIVVNGLVAARDNQPYIQLLTTQHGIICQLSMSEARSFAHDVLLMCARTEADAMIHLFFSRSEFPAGAAAHLMMMFRDFRSELDSQKVERSESDPETGEKR